MATESPIFVESFSNQFTQSFRATAANGLQHFPATFETVWDPSDLPPPLPPAGLSPNGAPASNVQLAVVTLQPGPLANTFQFLAATPPVPLPPPLLVAAIDRVIPNTWGAQALIPGAYQQGVTDASGTAVPYAETKWVVDGVNRFLEFPYGTPAGFLAGSSAPTLRFYRYTGGIAGGGGGGGGTVVGGANLGGGARVFDDFASGATLFFRTLVAGAGIAVVEDVFPGEITISRQPPPDNVDLYVSAFGDDALGNGTASLPYQTLQRAFLDIRNSGWNDTAFVNIATTFLPLTIAGQVDLNVGSLGAQAHDVVVRGGARAVFATDTIVSAQVDPVSKLLSISGGTLFPFPSSWVGRLIRFTSGALSAYTIEGAEPPAVVQAEAFVVAIESGDPVLAFTSSFSGGLPAPGDSFVVEGPTTELVISGTALLNAGVGRKLVFRDLIIRPPIGFGSTAALGFEDFSVQMLATVLAIDTGGTLTLGSLSGSFEASTQSANTTTVPSTAGVAVIPGGGGATFIRSGESTTADAVANSGFLGGSCIYQAGFTLRGSHVTSAALEGAIFVAGRVPSSVNSCWFRCEGLSTPDGRAVMWATNATSLQVESLRTSGGGASAIIYATEGGVVQVGQADVFGCQTALFAGRSGTISLTDGGAFVVNGGGGGAVVRVEEGGALTVVNSLSVTAGPGSSAVSIRAGTVTIEASLIASAVDADCVLLDQGATLRCATLDGVADGIVASHSAPAPGSAGARLRDGSRVVTRILQVPIGASGFGVLVEGGSSLHAYNLDLTATETALLVRSGGQVTADGGVFAAPVARIGVSVTDGTLFTTFLFCSSCVETGLQAERGAVTVTGDIIANGCGSVNLLAVTSTVLVGQVLQVEDGPVGASLQGSQLMASSIIADAPSIGAGVGLNLISSTVKVIGAVGLLGTLVASEAGAPRASGLSAMGSTINAGAVRAVGCLGGDGITLVESTLVAAIVDCDNCATNCIQAEKSRILAETIRASSAGTYGLITLASTIAVSNELVAQNSDIGVYLQGSDLSAGEILADGRGLWGLLLDSSSVKVVGELTSSRFGSPRNIGVEAINGSTIVASEVNAAECAADGVVLRGSTLRARTSTASTLAAGVIAVDGSTLYMDENSLAFNSGDHGVYVGLGSECVIRRSLIYANARDGVLVEKCSQIYLAGAVNSFVPPNGSYGLEVRYGSKAVAERGLTLTGAAGDVRLGTSGPVTWATLSGQVPATSTDLFSPQTEQCGVVVV